MLRFITQGKPFARGEQQGRACRELILPWIRDRLARAGLPSNEDVQQWIERTLRVDPDGIEENRGIASGLGMPEIEFFTAQYQFLHSPQCTTCCVRDARGRPLIVKTDDLFADEVGKNVLETTLPDRGHRHVHFHFAATTWTVAGMNEHGLCIAMTGIPGPRLDEDGVPSISALHAILPSCSTVREAIEHVRNLRINHYGFSLQLGDANGDAALVEKTGSGMVVLSDVQSLPLIHTNHILDAEFARQNPRQRSPIHLNGECRYTNAVTRMQSLSPTEDSLARLVADRAEVGAICQQGEDGMFTDFAVLFVPTEKRFTFWAGPPCRCKPETVMVASLFGVQ